MSQNVVMTVSELQELLLLSRSSAYALVNKNEFPVIRIGRSIRIPSKSFYSWLDKAGYEETNSQSQNCN